MKESYREGVASHPVPESCAGGREVLGEALTGVHIGRPLSRERNQIWVPTPSSGAEGNIAVRVSASARRTWRGRRTLACVETPCTEPGRSRGFSSRKGGLGTRREDESRTAAMNDHEKSDNPIVPRKQANKAPPKEGRGVGGGKEVGQGKPAPVRHAPYTVTESRHVIRAGAGTSCSVSGYQPSSPWPERMHERLTRGRSRMR